MSRARDLHTRMLQAAQRPIVSRGYDQAGWALTTKPTQWKVGVSADEWIEYVPAPEPSRCPECHCKIHGGECSRSGQYPVWRCNGCGRDAAGCICASSL